MSLRRDIKAPNTEQDFDFKAAISTHGKRKLALGNAALEGVPLDAASISRDDCCALGKLAYGPEGQRWGHSPIFVDLVEKHQVFHQGAGNSAQIINSGQGEKAERMRGGGMPFSEANHSVIGALHKLMREAANERPKDLTRMALSTSRGVNAHSRQR